jgi:hypothetical protein
MTVSLDTSSLVNSMSFPAYIARPGSASLR